MAHSQHGRLPWSEVVGEVAKLSREGFPVSGALASSVRTNFAFLKNDTRLAALFAPNGRMVVKGQKMVRPLLAATLESVAANGSAALYEGAIAAGIVETVRNNSFHPGVLTLEDLRNYVPVARVPLTGTFNGFTVVAAPPPASGGVVSMALSILEGCVTARCKQATFICLCLCLFVCLFVCFWMQFGTSSRCRL
jgi:gamma-glutamyltranspeptidase